MEKSFELVRNPQTPSGILRNTMHRPARNASYGSKPLPFQVSAPFYCRDPNSPARILKKRNRPMEFRISLAEACHLPVSPLIQPSGHREPNTLVLGGQGERDNVAQSSLFDRK